MSQCVLLFLGETFYAFGEGPLSLLSKVRLFTLCFPAETERCHHSTDSLTQVFYFIHQHRKQEDFLWLNIQSETNNININNYKRGCCFFSSEAYLNCIISCFVSHLITFNVFICLMILLQK